MDKVIELLKLFSEKHFIPAMISIPVAIVGFAYTDILEIKEKAGTAWYGLLLFCICFLIIELVNWLYNFIRNIYINSQYRKKASAYDEQELKIQLEKMWNYIDRLPVQDQNYLKTFLKTGNEPIESTGIFFGERLFNDTSLVDTTKRQKISSNQCWVVDTYKLKDDFYDLLKYSMEKYHKISHFAMEEKTDGQAENALGE